MKLPVLKNKFKNKYVIRIVAGVLVVAMVGTGASVYGLNNKTVATPDTTVTAVAEEVDADTNAAQGDEEKLTDALSSSLKINEVNIGKEETVYIVADNTGKATETIVSDHLINNDDKATLEDASSLTDIKNVKGDETFKQNGSKLTWQADGNDIYYQGTSDKETPITEAITYYLDGKEIKPEDLAGKSGKVTIHFDYTNNEKVTATVDGKDTEVCVPFVAITGMILNDSFKDVEVTNGKIVSDGNNNVVVGYALPGLKDSLNVKDSDFDSDITIPDYFEVSAQVEDFSLDMTMTVAMNATNFVSTEGDSDLSSIDDLLDTLTDATSQLQDGSGDLADGVDTLQSKLGEFSTGVGTLQSAIKDYTDGAATLATGIGTLKTGVDTLSQNVPALVTGVSDLKTGADSASTGAKTLADGSAQVSAGVNETVTTLMGMSSSFDSKKADVMSQYKQGTGIDYTDTDTYNTAITQLKGAQSMLVSGIEAYDAGNTETANTIFSGVHDQLALKEVDIPITNREEAITAIGTISDTIGSLTNAKGRADGALMAINQAGGAFTDETMVTKLKALQDGAAKVASGASDLSTGINKLDAGLSTLNDKTGTLSSGVTSLKDGTDKLYTGATTLIGNNEALNKGAGDVLDATSQISDGVGTLDDGAHKLADGIVQFNESGISEIVNSYDGDAKPLIERLQAVLDAGADYQTYTDIADNVNGSVKFIYKTAAIK